MGCRGKNLITYVCISLVELSSGSHVYSRCRWGLEDQVKKEEMNEFELNVLSLSDACFGDGGQGEASGN